MFRTPNPVSRTVRKIAGMHQGVTTPPQLPVKTTHKTPFAPLPSYPKETKLGAGFSSMRTDSAESMKDKYAGHPMSARNLVRKLEELGLELTAQNLALGLGSLSDHNNVGGPASTMALMRMTGVTQKDHVLDVGSGIGGPARHFASKAGHVTGCDLNGDRVDDARWLSKRVGQENVDFREAGLDDVAKEGEKFDVAVAQSSLIHIGTPDEVVPKLAACARRAIGVEELCLLREPTEDERADLAELNDIWGGKGKEIHPLSAWEGALGKVGKTTLAVDKDMAHVKRLAASAHKEDGWPDRELRGIALGKKLSESGLLGFFIAAVVKAKTE